MYTSKLFESYNKGLNESEELSNEEFKVGDIVKVPYKYGVYTPGEFIDAPIIDIENGNFITVEIPSKLVLTADQLRKYNKEIDESEKLTEDYSENSIVSLGYEVDEHLTDAYNLLLAYLQDINNTEKRNEINSFIDKLEELMNSINEELLAESIKVESEKLEEKRNPENDEANELIRNSLNNDEYAKNHTTELRKHGIKYIPPKKGEEWRGGALEGKQGRRLATREHKFDWDKDRVDNVTNSSYNDAYSSGYSHDDSYNDQTDLHQKTYKNSKEEVKNAKANINKQEAKVKRMEKKDKEAGLKWNEKTYKAQRTLDDYRNTIKNGIRGNYTNSDKIHPDTDLKSFLNAKKHSDRPLPREKDPKYRRHNGKIADPANKDVEDYKEVKSGKSYIARQKEQNKQQDQEDKDRIEQMKQRAKEEKNRRDTYLNKEEKEVNKLDSKIQSKLDAYRKRMTNK